MQRLQDAIDQYNASRTRCWDHDYTTLLAPGPAAEADLARLREREPRPLPAELEAFYRRFGGLHNHHNTESHCLELPAPAALAEGLERADEWQRIRSLGLVDVIVHSWGNDRYEFEPGEAFAQAELDALNAGYRCFGWYRTDTVSESAWYVYADAQERFGALYYDQDGFGHVERSLRAMLAASPARQSLEEVLCEGVERARQAMIEWHGDGSEDADSA
ncbi:hypothetical protein J5226_13030 [Lysobacter sp. K5869]|uniref:hypothetical protein n=1 Tax=Lysobacter sp. K5869 TaxID=2820808 RepID=UPI001C060D34|nr:hypothetical protein [Lysobacter sp. K5869]QWP74621.1 hypothetical protein J5226_13030 [Lysobacter sp. K5869]